MNFSGVLCEAAEDSAATEISLCEAGAPATKCYCCVAARNKKRHSTTRYHLFDNILIFYSPKRRLYNSIQSYLS